MKLWLVLFIMIVSNLCVAASAGAKADLFVSARPKADSRVKVPNAKATRIFDTVLTLTEFSNLKLPDQELYILGVRDLMSALEAEDVKDKIEYQASARTSRPSWLEALSATVSTAGAADANRRCIYAGWVSEMDVNGRYCMRPKSEGCARGQIQCNPLLYGENKCTQATRSATSFCVRSAKTPAQILKEIKKRGVDGQDEWAKLREEIGGYCESPRPSQTKVCSMVRARLLVLQRVVGLGERKTAEATTSETAEPSVVEPVPAPPVAASTDFDTNTPAPAVSEPAVVVRRVSGAPSTPEAVVVSAPTKTAAVAAPTTAGNLPAPTGGVCNPISLTGSLARSGEVGPTGLNLMDLASAQSLMCSRDSIPADWVAKITGRLALRLKESPTGDRYQQESKRNITQLAKNFQLCLQQARSLRAKNAPATWGSDGTLTYARDCKIDYRTPWKHVTAGNWSSEIEPVTVAEGVSLCNIRIIDSYGCGANSSQKELDRVVTPAPRRSKSTR